jgi:ABC-type Co2+ transport system permease subunit
MKCEIISTQALCSASLIQKARVFAMALYAKYVSLILISIFFAAFGVLLLISAYALTNPFEFIITFFAANFIILISAALCIGFVVQLIRFIRATGEARPKDPKVDP